jgi:hypothetical protein
MFRTNYVQKIKTHILWSILFPEIPAVYEIMRKKYRRAGNAADDNKMDVLCILDT